MIDVIIVGGGGHSKVVIECFARQSVNLVGIVDDVKTGELSGVEIIGQNVDPSFSGKLVIAIGDNANRKRIAESTNHLFLNAIHSTALLSSYAKIGVGCMIFHNTVIQPYTTIGNHVIINTAAQVDHDCIVGDYCHLAPGAILCGNVTVGEGAFIGAGASIIPSIKIGRWATVGAGSVVIRDVPDYAVVAGNPARSIKK